MADSIRTIIDAGGAATSQAILLLGFAGLIWGLYTGRIEIGPVIAERKTALKEANEALTEVQKELAFVQRTADRLEVERQFEWNHAATNSKTTNGPRVVRRKAITK